MYMEDMHLKTLLNVFDTMQQFQQQITTTPYDTIHSWNVKLEILKIDYCVTKFFFHWGKKGGVGVFHFI